MTDQPGWGPPEEEPAPPHPGWAAEQPPFTPPSAPPPGQPGTPPPGYPPPGYSGYQPPGYPPPGYPQQPYAGYAYVPPPAAKPGIIPLRPIGVGEILDGAIQCVRANPKIMLGLTAIVVTLSQLLSFALTVAFAQDITSLDPQTATTDEVLGAEGSFLGVQLIGGVISALAQVILTGVLTVVVSRAVLGQRITLGEAWTQLRPRIFSLVGVSLLVFLTASLALVACILPGIYLYTMWWLAAPALVLERIGVTAAMSRSWALVRSDFWRTFLVLLLTTVLTAVIAGIVSLPFSLVGAFSSFSSSSFGAISTASLFWDGLGSIVAGTLTYPFTAAVTVLVYIDRRMRLEGLDLELARAAAATPGGPAV